MEAEREYITPVDKILGLRECYVTEVGLCYFHGFGTHVSGDTRAIVESKERGNVIMVYPEMVHFKLPPSELHKLITKEAERFVKERSENNGS